MTFRKINKVYFVGIGGIGMSGIAELLLNLGFQVSGSDMNENDNVERLKSLGVDIKIGHDPANLTDADVLVYSSAVSLDNPEIIKACKNNHRNPFFTSFDYSRIFQRARAGLD